MNRHGFTLATGMLLITLLAADFTAFRYLPWPALDFTPLHITLSLLPMLNVLAILGYRFLRDSETRRPFAMGLLVFGLFAMLVHVSCVMLYHDQVKLTYIAPIGSFFQLCRTYRVPYYVGTSPEGYSYFRYYPAVVLINFFVPQILAAVLGAYGYHLVARCVRKGTLVSGPSVEA
jgi:hypothetical protein